MDWTVATAGLGVSMMLASTPASASTLQAREHVLPQRNDDLASRAATWTRSDAWRTSPPVGESAGSRVAAMASVRDGRVLPLQARGLRADGSGKCSARRGAGAWLPMETTYVGGELQVAVVDLEGSFDCAQLRLAEGDDARVGDLQWELIAPRYPDAGRNSRALTDFPRPPRDIPIQLEIIDVITREEWGARPTECTAIEDDWYRMAIHHTAGPQTANDSVIERLQATQAFSMDGGTFCDIPYQMLVGFDGTLYEGRALELQSGATGGGQNPGNLAVCFIGCYHDIDVECVGEQGHEVTDAMMQQGQLLVQTLVRLHDIDPAETNIMGHQDWPGNATACPGNLLHPRLQELRDDITWFAGLEMERSWDAEVEIEVEVGDSAELWIELENTGGLPWIPGETFLAPTGPREEGSPLQHSSWESANRAGTVETEVAPGQIGRFNLIVSPSAEETVTQTFGLVHEGVTWFADDPWGGGPSDDSIVVTVVGLPPVEDTGTSTGIMGTSGTGDTDDTAALPGADRGDDGCGCTTSNDRRGAGWWLLALVAVAGVRRRRRR